MPAKASSTKASAKPMAAAKGGRKQRSKTPQASKVTVQGSSSETGGVVAKAQKAAEATRSWVSANKGAAVAAATAIVLAALAAQPLVRWNVALFFYMPTLSGLYFNIRALQPVFDAYIAWELERSPAMFADAGIEEIAAADYTWAEFMRASQGMTRAVIVRGLYTDSKAAHTYGTEEWVEAYGDFSLQEIVDAKPDGFKYEYELVERGSFKDYIADIRNGSYRYSYGLDEIFTKHPHLVDDLEFPRYLHPAGGESGGDFCRSVAIFVSSGGQGLKWHNADHANFGMQIKGSKTFHLIDPFYSPFLGPDGNSDPYATGFACRSSREVFEKIPKIHVTLHPGDVIYLPVWWWHRVDSHGDPDSNLVIFNNCRFSKIKAAVVNQPILELYRHTGFVNWLHPKLPVAARWIPYMRVLQDGFREFFGTMPKWDSEDCFSSKREACDRYFKSIGWEIIKKH